VSVTFFSRLGTLSLMAPARFHEGRGLDVLREVGRSTVRVWSDAHFVRAADFDLQLQCSRAIGWICERVCGSGGDAAYRMDLMSLILSGVQLRLANPELRR
jgi:hypothetical protein